MDRSWIIRLVQYMVNLLFPVVESWRFSSYFGEECFELERTILSDADRANYSVTIRKPGLRFLSRFFEVRLGGDQRTGGERRTLDEINDSSSNGLVSVAGSIAQFDGSMPFSVSLLICGFTISRRSAFFAARSTIASGVNVTGADFEVSSNGARWPSATFHEAVDGVFVSLRGEVQRSYLLREDELARFLSVSLIRIGEDSHRYELPVHWSSGKFDTNCCRLRRDWVRGVPSGQFRFVVQFFGEEVALNERGADSVAEKKPYDELLSAANEELTANGVNIDLSVQGVGKRGQRYDPRPLLNDTKGLNVEFRMEARWSDRFVSKQEVPLEIYCGSESGRRLCLGRSLVIENGASQHSVFVPMDDLNRTFGNGHLTVGIRNEQGVIVEERIEIIDLEEQRRRKAIELVESLQMEYVQYGPALNQPELGVGTCLDDLERLDLRLKFGTSRFCSLVRDLKVGIDWSIEIATSGNIVCSSKAIFELRKAVSVEDFSLDIPRGHLPADDYIIRFFKADVEMGHLSFSVIPKESDPRILKSILKSVYADGARLLLSTSGKIIQNSVITSMVDEVRPEVWIRANGFNPHWRSVEGKVELLLKKGRGRATKLAETEASFGESGLCLNGLSVSVSDCKRICSDGGGKFIFRFEGREVSTIPFEYVSDARLVKRAEIRLIVEAVSKSDSGTVPFSEYDSTLYSGIRSRIDFSSRLRAPASCVPVAFSLKLGKQTIADGTIEYVWGGSGFELALPEIVIPDRQVEMAPRGAMMVLSVRVGDREIILEKQMASTGLPLNFEGAFDFNADSMAYDEDEYRRALADL